MVSRFLVLLLFLVLVGPLTGSAEPVTSPLQQSPDAIGAARQNSFVWANPPQNQLGQFVAFRKSFPLPLDQGFVPPERRERVTGYLPANRQRSERIMTVYYLHHQLYQADTEVFDREVLDTYRSKWQGVIKGGWQTVWEEFTGASKAHIYGMFPGYFLSSRVLGVRLDGPVWNHGRRGGLTLDGSSAVARTEGRYLVLETGLGPHHHIITFAKSVSSATQ